MAAWLPLALLVLIFGACTPDLDDGEEGVDFGWDDPLRGDKPLIITCPVEVLEGDDGSTFLEFPVYLRETQKHPLAIRYYTRDDSALSGNGDYIPQSGTLTFRPGERQSSIRVPIQSDSRYEGDETLFLDLKSDWSTRTTIGTIRDDDSQEDLLPLAWTIGQNLDSSEWAGHYSSCAVAPDGTVWIAYYHNRDKTLTLASFDGIAWHKDVIASDCGAITSKGLAFDRWGNAHVLYGATGGLVYMTNSSGVWESRMVYAGGYHGALAVDHNGKAHIVCTEFWLITYITNASGDWAVKPLFTAESDCSIAVDEAGFAHILFYHRDSGLSYTHNRSGRFEIALNVGYGGYENDVAIDSMGNVHIVHSTASAVHYITNRSGSLTFETIVNGLDYSRYSAMTLDRWDNLHVSFYNDEDGQLAYTTNKYGNWRFENVSGFYIQQFMNQSIAVDNGGNVFIPFFNANDYSFHLAVGCE